MKKLSWDDFKLVKTIADARGMAGAAEKLKVNHSTVFRQLAQVEKTLGMSLFDRHRSGYVLTPAGEEMTALAERMEDEIVDFTRKVVGQGMTPAGELRVTTNDVLMIHLLLPILSQYITTYPQIRLDIVQSNNALSLSKRDADIAIRATDAPPENLIGRRIGGIAWALYGSTEEFRQQETLPSLEETRTMCWVGLGESMNGSKPYHFLAQNVETDRFVLRLNTVLGIADAIENHVGIGVIPCYIGDTRPGLIRLTDPISQLETSLWLLTHADLRNSVRVRSFMDFMGVELSRQKAKLEGTD
jgi:Transcriptional regulator